MLNKPYFYFSIRNGQFVFQGNMSLGLLLKISATLLAAWQAENTLVYLQALVSNGVPGL